MHYTNSHYMTLQLASQFCSLLRTTVNAGLGDGKPATVIPKDSLFVCVSRNDRQREVAYHELRDKYLSCLQELVTSREGLHLVVHTLQ